MAESQEDASVLYSEVSVPSREASTKETDAASACDDDNILYSTLDFRAADGISSKSSTDDKADTLTKTTERFLYAKKVICFLSWLWLKMEALSVGKSVAVRKGTDLTRVGSVACLPKRLQGSLTSYGFLVPVGPRHFKRLCPAT
eukprot:m.542882 g.542882  ORF g.542882 m.542882 type:complete len:144 (+) comp22122_c0_seq4:258-689(+)